MSKLSENQIYKIIKALWFRSKKIKAIKEAIKNFVKNDNSIEFLK